jgi:hypothetical protein
MARAGNRIIKHRQVGTHTLSWYSDPQLAAEIFTHISFNTISFYMYEK